jgi:S1-C subfamily serine protease
MRFLSAILFVGFSALHCQAQLGSSTNLYDFKKFESNPVQKSLMRIHCKTEDGLTALGSGGVVGKDLILTAYHVVRGAASIEIVIPHKAYKTKAKLLYFDEATDLAILQASIPKAVRPLKIASKPPAQGELVQFLGFAGGSLPRHFDCKVLDVDNLAKQLLLNAPVIQGDSGGMILNSQNEVIGVIQRGQVAITRISHLESDTLFNPLLLALTIGHDCRVIDQFLKDNK